MVPSEAYRTLGAGEGGRGTEARDWAPHSAFLSDEGTLDLALGGFLVRTRDRVVLIDTGVGDLHRDPFHGGRLLEGLAAEGISPPDVTDVILTHLHFDHVGWTTRRGEIVFPNATYRCDQRDWAHFVGPDPGATRKLAPIEDRVEPWDGSGPLLARHRHHGRPGPHPGQHDHRHIVGNGTSTPPWRCRALSGGVDSTTSGRAWATWTRLWPSGPARP